MAAVDVVDAGPRSFYGVVMSVADTTPATGSLAGLSPSRAERLTQRWADVLTKLPSDTVEHFAEMQEQQILEAVRTGLDLVASSDDPVSAFQGPWVSPRAVQDALQVSREALSKQRERRQLLGVRFSDNRFYYPARQFERGRVIEGLSRVLNELAAGVDDAETWATWLASADPADPGRSMWDALRLGEVEAVVGAARRDAAGWLR